MQTYFGFLTIGAAPVQIPAFDGQNSFGNPCRGVCKLLVQAAPGNTAAIKIGGAPNMTADNTTAGIFVAAPTAAGMPGGSWEVESQQEHNEIMISQYYFHGSHAGDIVMYELHVSV